MADLVGALLTAEEEEVTGMANRDAVRQPSPTHRVGALTLVRDPRNRVLMVKPVSQNIWLLPGSLGGVREGENISDAAERELLGDSGLSRTITHLLAVDQVPCVPRSTPTDRFNWVCDGGTVTTEEARNACLPESAASELEGLSWIEVDELRNYTSAPQLKCVTEAVTSLHFGLGLPLLEFGERVETRKAVA
ncbi:MULTISPECIES: NUDIX domain-containing protein [unclassified Streptomyces]|uniref:NUDIX domain-containing protein n=1 Tax=unclassified Streptomyces TaxID=2593676 RepID=UPI001371FED1|nr:NUDIX hydrolase [Streptomyces sp. ScaeMP-e83]